MRAVIAVVFFAVFLLSARGALAVCCQCANANSPPAPAAALCSGLSGFCADMTEDGASAECASFGGTFSLGPDGSTCPIAEMGIGSLCEPAVTTTAAPAPTLSGHALTMLVGVLVLVGFIRIRRKTAA